MSQSFPAGIKYANPLRDEGSRFMRFCVVGTVGFLIEAGLLMWFINVFAFDPFTARLLSIGLAVTMTWAMHRNWTFDPGSSNRLSEWARFGAVNGVGATINYGTYATLLLFFTNLSPVLALAAGSVVALAANFLGSRLWAFRQEKAELS